jgi:hypothetical protein
MLATTCDSRWIFVAIRALGLVVLLGGIFLARFGKSRALWLSGVRGRDWPTVSALVDVVTVVQQVENNGHGERIIGYLATLTYFYRNPELQTGDYCRMFANRQEG